MTVDLKNAFRTFPLANAYKIEGDAEETIPSEEDVEEAKEWVDFKEM